MNKIWTIGAVLTWTQQFFQQKGKETPRLDAEILLAHVLHKERIYLYAHYDEPLNAEELAQYRQYIQQRAGGYSVAHIVGKKAFMGLDFFVSQDVLIPRPETELLVEYVVAHMGMEDSLHILDIGTGSGAILLSLLYYLPKATGVGVDISSAALAVAKKNALQLDVDKRVTWQQRDLCTAMPAQMFSIIVSNPPYLTAEDMKHLSPEVQYDPAGALFGGTDGLDFYRRLAIETSAYLNASGLCIVEIGKGQEKAVRQLFEWSQEYVLIEVIKDYSDISRHMVFRKE